MCNQHRHTEGTADLLPWCDPHKELPVETWIDFLDQLVAWSSLGRRQWIDITGGEPTLYAKLPEFIEAAKERGFFLNLLTNATRLASLADFIVDRGVEVVTVSLDGPGELHDRIRGQAGQFQRVVVGLEALRNARARAKSPGPIIALTCTITKANLAVLDQMVPLAEELGADSLLFQHTAFHTAENVADHNRALSPQFCQAQGLDVLHPSIPEGGWYASEITEDDLPVMLEATRRVKKLGDKSRIRVLFGPVSMRLSLLKAYYMDLAYPFPPVCDHLWKSLRVHPDGTVMPCLGFQAGNIAQAPVREIWNGPAFVNFRRMFLKGILPGCARCCARRYTVRSDLGLRQKPA
jgi:MoaA/NifB/PqqE/SkfB family radical SAM enzyme